MIYDNYYDNIYLKSHPYDLDSFYSPLQWVQNFNMKLNNFNVIIKILK